LYQQKDLEKLERRGGVRTAAEELARSYYRNKSFAAPFLAF